MLPSLDNLKDSGSSASRCFQLLEKTEINSPEMKLHHLTTRGTRLIFPQDKCICFVKHAYYISVNKQINKQMHC